MRLTPAQQRAMALLDAGRVLRARGRYGREQAERGAAAPEWPSRQTVARLLALGLIEPGETWGTWRRKGGGGC